MIERTYARATGWLYFALGIAGLFTDNLWHMFTLSGTMTIIHFAIGISGLTIALRGKLFSQRAYSLVIGLALTAWGVTGTLSPNLLNPYPLPLENALHVVTGIWGFYGLGSSFWQRHKG